MSRMVLVLEAQMSARPGGWASLKAVALLSRTVLVYCCTDALSVNSEAMADAVCLLRE